MPCHMCVRVCYLAQQAAGVAGCQVSRCLVYVNQGFPLHLLLIVPSVFSLRERETYRHTAETDLEF